MWGLKAASVLLQISALVLFFAGYFPPETPLDDSNTTTSNKCLLAVPPPVDDLYIVPIRGLTIDFLAENPVISTILNGMTENGFHLTYHGHQPTTTMPKMGAELKENKIFNQLMSFLPSTAYSEDTWLRRLVDDDTNTAEMLPETAAKNAITGKTNYSDDESFKNKKKFFVAVIPEMDDNDLDFSKLYFSTLFNRFQNDTGRSTLLVVVGDHGSDKLPVKWNRMMNMRHKSADVKVPVFASGRLPEGFRFKNQHIDVGQIDFSSSLYSLWDDQVLPRDLGVSILGDILVLNNASKSFLSKTLLDSGLRLKDVPGYSKVGFGHRFLMNFCFSLLEKNLDSDGGMREETFFKCKAVFLDVQSALKAIPIDVNYTQIHYAFFLSALSLFLAYWNSELTLKFWSDSQYYLLAVVPFTYFACIYRMDSDVYIEESLEHCFVVVLGGYSARSLWKAFRHAEVTVFTFPAPLLIFNFWSQFRYIPNVKYLLPPAKYMSIDYDRHVYLTYLQVFFLSVTLLSSMYMLCYLHSGSSYLKACMIVSMMVQGILPPEVWTGNIFLIGVTYILLVYQLFHHKFTDFLIFLCFTLASNEGRLFLVLGTMLGLVLVANANGNLLGYYLGYLLTACFTGYFHSFITDDVFGVFANVPYLHPILSGFQTLVVFYSGPIMLLIQTKLAGETLKKFTDLVFFCRLASMFFCILMLFVRCEDMFIWTIFAPKMLYELCHFCCDMVVLVLINLPVFKF